MEDRVLLAATITVNTAADENTPGDATLSLREAIALFDGTLDPASLSPQEQAQISISPSGPDTIAFNIPVSGVPVIALTSPLPAITVPLAVDGTTQPTTKLVGIDGVAAGAGANGLTISGGNSLVRGLEIVRFQGSGFVVTTHGGVAIVGNLVGTDPTGDSGLGNAGDGVTIINAPGNQLVSNAISGNRANGIALSGPGATGNLVQGNLIGNDRAGGQALGNGQNGIAVTSSGNTIGGTAPGAGNLISGNGASGITISGSSGNTVGGNIIAGNFIGTDPAGDPGLGNAGDGVTIANALQNLIVGNTLSGNQVNGLTLSGPGATGNLVQGNHIGTDPTGRFAVKNGQNGVMITSSDNNTIGGTTPAARNFISGNSREGILILAGATSNLVQGNDIGLDASGTIAMPNGIDGVGISDSSGNTIGGAIPGAGNVISGNGNIGILIAVQTGNATGNLVQGNIIGTDPSGQLRLGNTTTGIFILNSPGNTIGGVAPDAANVISSNRSAARPRSAMWSRGT